jgi:hypothetical protein
MDGRRKPPRPPSCSHGLYHVHTDPVAFILPAAFLPPSPARRGPRMTAQIPAAAVPAVRDAAAVPAQWPLAAAACLRAGRVRGSGRLRRLGHVQAVVLRMKEGGRCSGATRRARRATVDSARPCCGGRRRGRVLVAGPTRVGPPEGDSRRLCSTAARGGGTAGAGEAVLVARRTSAGRAADALARRS